MAHDDYDVDERGRIPAAVGGQHVSPAWSAVLSGGFDIAPRGPK